MKLADIEFLRLLPQFMREDPAVQGLASAMDAIIPGIAGSVAKLSTWNKIDEASEAELDELAWELNIPWYSIDANLETKRDIVKNSDLVYKRLGTKWAVENVINSYFGEGHITEWFEYGGDPGHFRVYSTNPSLSNEKLNEFLHLLSNVKRASAKLDGIYISLTGQMPMAAGIAYREVSKEQYAIGATMQ